jgi:cation diffusion facilitator CzcD-associated flavoprotein CzcO
MTSHTAAEHSPKIVIIGAGFAGITMTLYLKDAGFSDITILEKSDDLGGVWRDNTYPGAACDVPSPLYSISKAANPAWPQRFSEQPDIFAYLHSVAEKHGIDHLVRTDSEVSDAAFDQRSNTWRVNTTAGETFDCDVLIPAVGQLSQPAIPALPGANTFAGTAFHSARWNHTQDLSGKRVAVIGTGASAVQFVPAITQQVQQLTLFQRSAPWILPKPDRRYRRWHHGLFRHLPATRLAGRFGVWLVFELLALALVDAKPLGPIVAMLARLHLRRQVKDPILRARLTPDHAPGCKRALFSNDYYPALTGPNTEVVSEPIDAVESHGIRTADGTTHPVDVIIYGTGFSATEFLAPMRIQGRDGHALDETWADGAHAYLGIAVPDFPNLFVLYGPNTNLGSGSVIYMLETQARHITALVEVLAQHPRHALEVDARVEEGFNNQLQRRLDNSVWTLCSSWYRTASGTIPTNWPGTTAAYRLRAQRPNTNDYVLTPRSPPAREDRSTLGV